MFLMTTTMSDAQEQEVIKEEHEEAAAEAPAEEAAEAPAADAEPEADVAVEEAPPETEVAGEGEAKEASAEGEEGVNEAQAAEGVEGQEGQDAGEGGEAVEAVETSEAGEQQQAPEGVEGEGGETGKEEEVGEAAAPAEDGAAEAESADKPAEDAEAEQAEGAEPVEGEAAEGEEKTESAEAGEEGEKKDEEGETEKVEGAEAEKVEEEGEEKAEGDDTEKKEDEEPEDKAEGEKIEEAPVEEAERVESPVAVGEKLSRGATPEVTEASQLDHERLEATTPERLHEEDTDLHEMREEDMVVEEEEEEMEEPHFKREELIEKYHEALADREQLQSQNYSLQHKLAEYFRKKKADERQDYDKNVTDQEQRYLKYMAQLEDLRRQDSMEKDNYRAQIEESKARCQYRKETVDMERSKFMEFKMQVALKAINSRSGKPIPPKDIEQYMINESKKEKEVVDVRLENIKLKNKLKKKEQQLKSKEELAEGLHLIDFEQLKIENQTYNEKIEERNEELLKLRKKITSTVQVLTHLKEKLQFVQGERLERSEMLKEVEASLAQSRDILSRTKQARDALRIDNQRLRQSCGLLGNEPLLRDFEERKDEGDDLRTKLDQLRMKHAELTLHCNQVRRKIEQARASMA